MIRCLLLSLLLCLPAVAQDRRERTFGSGALPEYLAIYDADNSGALSGEELRVLKNDRDRRNRLRRRWDSDGDGVISSQEREAAKNMVRETIIARRSLRFDEADLNNDGLLTLEEFRRIEAVAERDQLLAGSSNRLFNSLDGDRNSEVSKREFLLTLETLPTDIDMQNEPRGKDPSQVTQEDGNEPADPAPRQ